MRRQQLPTKRFKIQGGFKAVMITYNNIIRHDNIQFEEYLKMPGYSQSFLKSERHGLKAEIEITNNIRLGKLVDGILTEPATVNMRDELYPVAKGVVNEIKNFFGFALPHFKTQVSYTADVMYNGFTLPTKSRLDFLLEKQLVLDLKVTMSKDFRGIIDWMGYENQVWHYSKSAQVPKGFLLMHSVPLKKTQLFTVPMPDSNSFWENKVIKFGNHGEILS
jgi:hypothetical protein